MKFSIITLALLGGTLPVVFSSPSPQNNAPSSRYCSRHPHRQECKPSSSLVISSTKVATTASSTAVATTTPTTSGTPAPTPPADCSAGSMQITSFTWFNASSNLNCPLAADPEGLCFTGKPVQPAGYGPPDYVSFTVRNTVTSRSSTCIYQNPGSVPASGEPGRAGGTKCSTGDQTFIFTFTAGASNGMGGSATAGLSVTDRVTSCK
jgi:hypothetical protein